MPSSYSDIQSFSFVEVLLRLSMPSRFPLTMTSADFCQYPMTSLFCHQFAASPLARNSANITDRSLRVRIYTFSSCGHCIYVAILRTVKGFCFFCNITHITPPNMQFLFVGPNLCRQLLSDSQSPATPLLLANTPYCKAYSGLAPYSLYPCLTHKKIAHPMQECAISIEQFIDNQRKSVQYYFE